MRPKLGVNLTSPYHSAVPLSLLRSGDADFCEILIDNFLHLDPATFRRSLGEAPVGFHVMNSHFFDGDPAAVRRIGERIRALAKELNPLYISDHLAYFYSGTRHLPAPFEINYSVELKRTMNRVAEYQDILGQPVLLENFPSTLDHGREQPEFYSELISRTGCGILFDASNAVVGELNCGSPARGWTPLAAKVRHAHVAGYAVLESSPPLTVDSHDTEVSESTIGFLRDLSPVVTELATIVVERDANIELDSWKRDIHAVRSALGESRDALVA